MRDGWVETTLGEVSALQMGRTPSRRENSYWTDDLTYPFCTIADMDAKYVEPKREGVTKAAIMDGKAKMATKGTLLMSFKLTIGRMGFAARDIFPNEAIVMIEADESKVLNEFLYLRLASMDLTEGSGRAVKGSTLNSASIASIAFLVPPLPEQKRIVDLISSVDCYVEALQQQLESAKRSRNAVLHELLSSGGDDWVEHKLIDMFEIYQPQTIAKSLMSNDGEFIVFGANGPIGRYHEFNHEEPEVVVTCRGATCGTINMTPPKTWITGNAMVVSPKTSEVSKDFLYWALVAGVDIQSVISGSAQPQITREGLAPVKINIPPLSRQEEIVDLISGFEVNISHLEESLNKTKTLRSGLLFDLLSGSHEFPTTYDKVIGAA